KGLGNQRNVVVKVVCSLAGSKIDTEAGSVHPGIGDQPGMGQRPFRGGQGETGIGPGLLPPLRLVNVAAEVEVSNLRGKACGEGAGVEVGDRADAAAAFNLCAE